MAGGHGHLVARVGRQMTDDGADEEAVSELLATVRKVVAERADATLIEFREADAGSVEVVLKEEDEETEPERVLYLVTREPDLDPEAHLHEDHLHWEYLGEVTSDAG